MKFSSTHAKYLTNNPIGKGLVAGFFREIRDLTSGLEFTTVLDAGCGEGNLLKYLGRPDDGRRYCAVDYDDAEIEKARVNIPFCVVKQASIYSLPFPDSSFDLVICTEVLEHLENPEEGLRELQRVASRYVVLSVPREPLWRVFNIARLHYLKELGNTPGHINHWSTGSFRGFVSPWFTVIRVRRPLPWTIILTVK